MEEEEEIEAFKKQISLPSLVDQSFVIQSVAYATSQVDENWEYGMQLGTGGVRIIADFRSPLLLS